MVLSPLLGLAERQPQRRWAAGSEPGVASGEATVGPGTIAPPAISLPMTFKSPTLPPAETNYDFLSPIVLTQMAAPAMKTRFNDLWDQWCLLRWFTLALPPPLSNWSFLVCVSLCIVWELQISLY